MMGHMPLCLDTDSHKALYEVDVRKAEIKDSLDIVADEYHQSTLNHWNNSGAVTLRTPKTSLGICRRARTAGRSVDIAFHV